MIIPQGVILFGGFMPIGTVRRFDRKKGYGFIDAEDELGSDVFVHYSDILIDGYKVLEVGQRVEFELAETDRGFKATNVRPIP